MKNIENSKTLSFCQGQVGLSDFIELIRVQIEYEAFEGKYRERVDNIVMIIAEVACLRPGTEIQIEEMKLPAELVQEVFSKLEHEHVLTVLENFEALTYTVTHVKSYLRTALYNAVLENANRTQNMLSVYFPGFGG